MHRHVLAVSTALAASACAVHPGARSAVTARASAPTKVTSNEKTDSAADRDAKSRGPKLGDYRVYEYAGTFTKSPVKVTEKVVAKWDDVLVEDFVMEERSKKTSLRVRLKDGEVQMVTHLGDSGEAPGTLADYEALVKKTQMVPDSNDGAIGTEHTSCMVGEEQVACDQTSYRVSIGGKEAKLAVTNSDKIPGYDIGGKIVAKDGTVLYSARLIERGNEPSAHDSFEKAELERFESNPYDR